MFGPCTVPYVVDGDTVDVRCGRVCDRVRLLRINTPERGEAGYQEAKSSLEAMVREGNVYLSFEVPGKPKQGGYKRLLAYLYVDGRNLNVEMIRQGWSHFWTKYGKGRLFEADLHEAEQEARRTGRGLWAKQ